MAPAAPQTLASVAASVAHTVSDDLWLSAAGESEGEKENERRLELFFMKTGSFF